jgi:class 3 adenylate cyclase/tetratricopeptide (TPR) repeat protein
MIGIAAWLEQLDLAKYAPIFTENEVELVDLSELSEDDLKEIGLPLGPRRRILKALHELHAENHVHGESSGNETANSHVGAEAERRQLTVLFCDLVGSTALSGQLDPEDLREVMRQYQDAVAGVVVRHDGFVANFLGDGIVAYFGWPRATEDQAVQAVRAGLACVEAVRNAAGKDTLLQCRVGVASGQVVAGDLVGTTSYQSSAVSGETPNLAARLQGVAEPNQVVLGGLTRQLIGNVFEFEELGERPLRGIAQPVPVCRILREAPTDSRFEARGGRLTRFIGRDHELGLLNDRWQRAIAGEGQVVLLSGEAGIGKSRLMHEFTESVSDDQPIRLRCQCSAGHIRSALYPVIQHLQHAAGFTDSDDDEIRLDKLEAYLTTDDNETRSLIAAMLSLPTDRRYGATDLMPQERKQRTLAALVSELIRLTADRPVLFLFEDAHWIDPTTQELMLAAAARAGEARLFMLVTHRPEYRPDWAAHLYTTTLSLNRVTREQVEIMVRAMVRNNDGHGIVAEVVARAEGIPLFVEELTKSLLEANGDAHAGDIPATLQALLTARIDSLGDAKSLAQVGAVIGREFDEELLTAIGEPSDADLQDGLTRLVASELVHFLGGAPQAIYTFKHALIQDAAYGSLTRERRRALHSRAAAAILKVRPEMTETEPEIVANHYAGAGDAENATCYFEKAGRLAAGRTANEEALSHFDQAEHWALQISDPALSQSRQLEIAVLRGPVLMAARGTPSEAVGQAYLEAKTLAEKAADKPRMFTILFGQWHHHSVRGEHNACQQIGGELLALAEADGDSGHLLQAHHATWTTLCVTGDFNRCDQHAEAGLQLYDAERHADHRYLYGAHDPKVCALQFGAMAKGMLGFPEQALARIDEFMAIADSLEHPFTRSVAHLFAAQIHYFFTGQLEEAIRAARAGIEMSTTRRLPTWVPAMSVIAATAEAEIGSAPGAIAEIDNAMEAWASSGAGVFVPWQHLMAARVHRRQGRRDRAFDQIASGLNIASKNSEHWMSAELLRLKAELLTDGRSADADRLEARNSLQQAIALAGKQGALALELRAATVLARLMRDQSEHAEAYNLLETVYGRFTEGFDMQDLVEAKALMDELA